MVTPGHEVIQGEHITLRLLTVADASETYALWLADPEVNAFLETRHATVPELEAYIAQKRASPTAIFFGIFWQENNRHIGNIKLEPIDTERGIATMGILIGDKAYWGRGVATEATECIIRFARVVLGLRTIELGVRPGNTAAIHVYEKCGFAVSRSEDNQLFMTKNIHV